jgi:hypothetical protein
MSQIFDGLQRLEAERSGIDLPELSGVTELLQRAELRAASRWETAVPDEQSDATKSVNHNTVGLLEMSQIAATPEAAAAVEPLLNAEHLDPFRQFQSLKVSLAPQSRLVSLTENGSPAAEAFRLLAVRLRHLRRDRSLKKVLITSTIPQEGKSMVAGNLACCWREICGARLYRRCSGSEGIQVSVNGCRVSAV